MDGGRLVNGLGILVKKDKQPCITGACTIPKARYTLPKTMSLVICTLAEDA